MDYPELRKRVARVSNLKNNAVTLVEKNNRDKENSLETITITNIPTDSLVFRTDGIIVDKLFSNKVEGYNKHSDYAIVLKDRIVLIELKSTIVNEDECILKFKSDLCILDYADSVFKNICNDSEFFNKITKYYVVFYLDPMPKTTTQLDNSKPNTRPSEFKKIGIQDGSEVPLGMLF